MAEQDLIFIHLADIHFNKHSGDYYDLDSDLRNEIQKDIKRFQQEVNCSPAGILISGDIAYSGIKSEYERAVFFLQELSKVLDIPETSVFCVPGNHDVDQGITKDNPFLDDAQQILSDSNDNVINTTLTKYLRSGHSAMVMFSHIHEYNRFAAKYSCCIDNDAPCTKRDFELNDTSILRVRSLNSVIISSHRDCKGRLMVLGEYQIQPRQEGVTEICLCHHPPEYWRDNDATKNKLNERYGIQLYGHKHIQTAKQIDNTLILGAGAHPLRSEKDWRPRYNWLLMHVEESGGKRILKVRIYPRMLNQTNDHFIPDTNSCGGKIFKPYDLLLEDWDKTQNTKDLLDKKDPTESNLQIMMEIEQTNNTPEDNSIKNPFRILVYRFLGLSYTSRELILSELGLNSDEDDGVEHIKLIEKILERAKEKNILADFWDKVESAHNDSKYKENPFRVKN